MTDPYSHSKRKIDLLRATACLLLVLLLPGNAFSEEESHSAAAARPVAPDISVSATRVHFGQLDSGQFAETTLTVRNQGRTPLTIESFSSSDRQFSAIPDSGLVVTRGGKLRVTLRFTPADYGEQTARLVIHSNDPDEAAVQVSLSGAGPEQTSGTPVINAGGIVDAAGFGPTLAPGGIASLFGTSLAGILAAAADTPLPTELAGTRVEANGIACPLFFISPEQINFQLPFEVPTGGQAQIVVIRDGVASEPEPAAVAEYGPGIFMNPETSEPIIQRHPDNALITAENPAKPGDVLIVFLTGIGGLDNPPPTGEVASTAPLSISLVTPTVTLGTNATNVLFAGLSPGSVGLGQVNTVLPTEIASLTEASTPQGALVAQSTPTLPMVIRFGDSESQVVDVPVVPSAPPPGLIELSPTSLTFSSVELGQSEDLPLTIRNSGEGPLTVSGLTSNNTQFAVVDTQLPFTIEAGQQRALTVRFRPSQIGSQTAVLTVASDDPDQPALDVPLSGAGIEPPPPPAMTPDISVSPDSLDFEGVVLGQSATEFFTVSNNGDGELRVFSISSDDEQYSVVSPGPSFLVPPAGEQDVQVRFTPTRTNFFLPATLSINSDDPDDPVTTVAVEGFGRLPQADLRFGGVVVGSVRTLSTPITNTTGQNVTVTRIRSDSNQFVVVFDSGVESGTPRTPFNLPNGEGFFASVRFSPTSPGTKQGVLRFETRELPVFVLTMEGEGLPF